MPRFAANLSTMFTEVPFMDRFEAAAAASFRAVEYLFPYDYDAQALAARLAEHGLQQALFNAPPGDWEAGERGLAVLAGRDEEYERSISQALDYARALDCPRLHVMAGHGPADAVSSTRYVERLRLAADEAARAGCEVTIEPINPLDMPGYFLHSIHQGRDLIERIGRTNVGLQFDVYHAQIIHGDVTRLLRSVVDVVTHVQIAAVPDRDEPDRGELSFPYVLDQLDRAGYTGWIGCEYFPNSTTTAGLAWLDRYQTT